MPAPTKRATPAKKAARRPVAAKVEPTQDDHVIAGEVIDQGEPEQPDGGLRNADGSPLKKATVRAAGRDFVVAIPDAAQLAIMKRFANRYGHVTGEMSGDQAIAMTDAAIAAIQAILDDDADKQWVEIALLSKEVKLEDLQPIMDQGMKSLVDANKNRAERRAAEHGPKAKRAALATPE